MNFTKTVLKQGVDDTRYDEDFILMSFLWSATKQGSKYWDKIDKEYIKWYNNGKPMSLNECSNMGNPTDKAFIDGYNTALDDAAEWFTVWLSQGNTIDDWVRDSKVVDSGIEKFFNELGE